MCRARLSTLDTMLQTLDLGLWTLDFSLYPEAEFGSGIGLSGSGVKGVASSIVAEALPLHHSELIGRG